jgi:murein DD-endopeptidase MepM/ murein hydrolase activator NlpD
MRVNSAFAQPKPRDSARFVRPLLRAFLLLSDALRAPRRSKRAAVLAGLAAAALVGAGFGLSVPRAGVDPAAPPLVDQEAASGDRPLAATIAPAPDLRLSAPQASAPQASAPQASGPALRPARATASTAASPPAARDPAGRIALAVEAAPAAVNRLVEVRRGDTLMKLLVESGVERREAHNAVTALAEVFSPRKLKAGQVVRLAMLPAGAGKRDAAPGSAPGSATASDATDESLRLISLGLTTNPEEDVLVDRQADDSFAARVEARPLEPRLSAFSGTIETSLFETARANGMPVSAVVELIRLFSFDVDFQREIQPGDRFEVIYDSFYDDSGTFAKTGPLTYAAMELSGKRLEFYHFVMPDGSDDHFDAKGRSVRRALLKTPVDGARISSGFGMRKHPIQGYNKMHRGVDFAAPRGTPIYAAGKGVIERIGPNGGYGKYIRIRHNSTYDTAYAHLNGFAKGVKRGTRVQQGQVIGYVGSTGRSTGPHLHYEILVDNKQVDPRTIKLPSGKSLRARDLEAFLEARAEIDRLRAEHLPGVMMVRNDCAEAGDLAVAPAAEGDAQAAAESC